MSAHVAKSAVYIVSAKRTALGAFGGKLKVIISTHFAFIFNLDNPMMMIITGLHRQ